jgi:uncharacterized protein
MGPERDLAKVAHAIDQQGVPWLSPRFVTAAELEAGGAAMETVPTLLDLVRGYRQFDLGRPVVGGWLVDHAHFARTRAQSEAKHDHTCDGRGGDLTLRNHMKSPKNKDPKRVLLFAAGCVALGLAVVGVFLPVVPQVPFAILAAYLFSKSSRKLHKWIRDNKYLGRPVKDWEDHRVVRPKLKIFSSLAMVGGAVLGHFTLDKLGFSIGLDVLFAAAIVFVLTRRSKPPRAAASG